MVSFSGGSAGGVVGAGDPQSWNAYTYVRNNPLRLIDPSGMRYEDANTANPDRSRP